MWRAASAMTVSVPDRPERLGDRGRVGDVERHRHDARPEGLGELRDEAVESLPGEVGRRHRAALLEQRPAQAGADRARGPGDDRHLAFEHWPSRAQLGVLEAVVLHVEELRFRQAFIGADRRHLRLHGEGVGGDVARNGRRTQIGCGAERAEARQEDHARQRVEAADAVAEPVGVPSEVRLVVGGVAPDRCADLLGQRGLVLVCRRIDPEGEGLGADQVVRGERRRQSGCAAAVAVDEVENLGRDEREDDHATVRPVGVARGLGQRPAEHRGDHAQARARRVEPPRDRGARTCGTLPCQILLRARHEVDHGLVRSPRARPPRHEPVPHPHHSTSVGVRLVRFRDGTRELEARPHVAQHHHLVTERLAHHPLSVRLVRQRQDGVGVRVVDVRGREERVHERLDRGRGAPRVEQVRPQLVRHRLVVEPRQGPELP
jgi:hypothetical protein